MKRAMNNIIYSMKINQNTHMLCINDCTNTHDIIIYDKFTIQGMRNIKKYMSYLFFNKNKISLVCTNPNPQIIECSQDNIFELFNTIENSIYYNINDLCCFLLNHFNFENNTRYNIYILQFQYNYSNNTYLSDIIDLANNSNNIYVDLFSQNYINKQNSSNVTIHTKKSLYQSFKNDYSEQIYSLIIKSFSSIKIELINCEYYLGDTCVSLMDPNNNLLIKTYDEFVTLKIHKGNTFSSTTINLQKSNKTITPKDYLTCLINLIQNTNENNFLFTIEAINKFYKKNFDQKTNNIIKFITGNFVKSILTNNLLKSNNDVINKIYDLAKKIPVMIEDKSYIIKNIKKVNDNFIIDYPQKTYNPSPELDKSIKIFKSCIKKSNWTEELLNNSGIGILIKTNQYNISTKGYVVENIIREVTTVFCSCKNYIDLIDKYYEPDDYRYEIYNLENKNSPIDRVIGKGYSMIPLYINKDHWKTTKKYFEIMTSIAITKNPLCYTNNEYIVYNALLKLIIKIFESTEDNLDKFINTYIALWRTCAEISFKNKYNRGISKHIKNFLIHSFNKITYSKENIILGQIITTNLKVNQKNIRDIICYFLENIIYLNLVNNYEFTCRSRQFILKIKTSRTKKIKYNTINKFVNDCKKIINYNSCDIKTLLGFIQMYEIMDNIVDDIGGFNKFIKLLERNYGLLPQKHVDKLRSKIKINLFNKKNIFNDLLKKIYCDNNIDDRLTCYILQSTLYPSYKIQKNAHKYRHYINFQKYPIQKKNMYESFLESIKHKN